MSGHRMLLLKGDPYRRDPVTYGFRDINAGTVPGMSGSPDVGTDRRERVPAGSRIAGNTIETAGR
jgi:hypothetical protein